jgi:hypothetical protein
MVDRWEIFGDHLYCCSNPISCCLTPRFVAQQQWQTFAHHEPYELEDKSARNPNLWAQNPWFSRDFPWNKSIVSYPLNKHIHEYDFTHIYTWYNIWTHFTDSWYFTIHSWVSQVLTLEARPEVRQIGHGRCTDELEISNHEVMVELTS